MSTPTDFERPARVLVVEDDDAISQVLQRSLRMEGYDVRVAGDGMEALDEAHAFLPDLVILDLGLPKLDGLEVAKTLRETDDVPILVLTARDAVESRVEGLDAGADDYLTKPFSNDELLARVRALSRRKSELVGTEEIIIGKSKFLPRRGELQFGRNYNQSITLTLKETGILEILAQTPNVPVTKEDLLNKLWGPENDGDVNIVEVFVSYLRKKIKPEVCGFSIATQRNLGYKLKDK